MLLLFKKRGRWGIFPVQKTRKYNRVSNIARKWLLTCQILTSNSFQDCVIIIGVAGTKKKALRYGRLISFSPLLLRYCYVFCFWCLILILDFMFQEYWVGISIYTGRWRKLAWQNFVTVFFFCICKFCKFVNCKERINR